MGADVVEEMMRGSSEKVVNGLPSTDILQVAEKGKFSADERG